MRVTDVLVETSEYIFMPPPNSDDPVVFNQKLPQRFEVQVEWIRVECVYSYVAKGHISERIKSYMSELTCSFVRVEGTGGAVE